MLLTITTSNRPELLQRTLASLSANCSDLSLIDGAVMLDDGSPAGVESEMADRLKACLPGRKVDLISSGAVQGHAKQMQTWYAQLAGDFIFHTEDDWEFVFPGKYISQALDVLTENDRIGQVSLWNMGYNRLRKTASGVAYWALEIGHGRFTTGPAIVRVAAVRDIGMPADVKWFETAYGTRWTEGGWSTVHLAWPTASNIGGGQSAYAINGTKR